ncbi:MAG TPA: hypothetical protein VFP54_02925 [Acidimicrobiales bacterium]|nr:hypothetical protein [Acidimicrobiales bacterium]
MSGSNERASGACRFGTDLLWIKEKRPPSTIAGANVSPKAKG